MENQLKCIFPGMFPLPFSGRMTFFLPDILTHISDSFVNLSYVDIVLTNIYLKNKLPEASAGVKWHSQ